jgi:hypothetical protein
MWLEKRWWVIGTWVGAALVAVPSLFYEPDKGKEWYLWPVLAGLALGILAPLHEANVNGQWFLPTGGQLMCPLVASKTAR